MRTPSSTPPPPYSQQRRSDPDFVEVEVVSPGGKSSAQTSYADSNNAASGVTEAAPKDRIFAVVAHVLDELFRIPGTKIKLGIDPLLSLIPGLGDSSSAVVSAMLIIRGAQAGLPKIVLARMALNVIVNAILGAIPGLGSVATIFYRSNMQNYRLYEQNIGRPGVTKKADWLFVGGLIGGMLLVLVMVITISLMIFAALWHAAWGR